MRRGTDAGVERAFAEGSILRTHVLQADVALRGARRHPLDAGADRPAYQDRDRLLRARRSLDENAFKRSRRLLKRALDGGQQLTRAALRQVFQRERLPTTGIPLSC
jgi:hypothetical protein